MQHACEMLAQWATLSDAFSRYMELTFPHPAPSAPAGGKGTAAQAAAVAGAISGVKVKVASQDESAPALATDESYSLTVPAGPRVLRFVPPLVVSEAEVDEALGVIETALTQLTAA